MLAVDMSDAGNTLSESTLAGPAIAIARRSLLVAAIGLWVGGFTFYALFVLPQAHDVLDSHLQSGLITRGVTLHLNRIGVIAIGLMLWDVLASRQSRTLVTVLLVLWFTIAVAHGGLFLMHDRLSNMIDAHAGVMVDRDLFRSVHTRYEQVSGVQWCATLAYLVTTLIAWRHQDR